MRGEPIGFGDATQESVLLHVGIMDARVMAIAISDPAATRRITELARRLSPDLYIIARTRYLHEMKTLHELGANEVIPEEYETSVEIFVRVLERYQVPRAEIEDFVEHVRSDNYEMFRSLSTDPYCDANLRLISDEVTMLTVSKGSPAEGKIVEEMGLKGYGIELLAVYRDREALINPDKGLKLLADDVVILMGPQESISSVKGVFENLAES